MSPFTFDDQFSIIALHKLEAADIPVVTALTEKFKQGHCPVSGVLKRDCYDSLVASDQHWRAFLDEWLSSEPADRSLPPTWRSLFEVLRQLDLEWLSQDIEDHLMISELIILCARDDAHELQVDRDEPLLDYIHMQCGCGYNPCQYE